MYQFCIYILTFPDGDKYNNIIIQILANYGGDSTTVLTDVKRNLESYFYSRSNSQG